MQKLRLVFYFTLCVFLLSTQSALADEKSYVEPNHSQKSALPELYSDEGKTVRKGQISIVVAPFTVSYDSYVAYGVVPKVFPIHIGRYWQVSPIHDVWFKSQHNDAKILQPNKSSIISIPYRLADLEILPGVAFNENTLKIVHSDNRGTSWTMLRGSVVDSENKTVSAITDIGGGFMLMAGFVEPTQYVNYRKIKGAYIMNSDLKERIIKSEISDAPFYIKARYVLFDAALSLYYNLIPASWRSRL